MCFMRCCRSLVMTTKENLMTILEQQILGGLQVRLKLLTQKENNVTRQSLTFHTLQLM